MNYRAKKLVVTPWMAANERYAEYPGVAVMLPEGAVGVTVTPIPGSSDVAVCWLEPSP